MRLEIRVLALGAVRRGDELLVQECEGPETGDPFYRLLGGEVEFGEHSREAVVREFDEELAVEYADPTLVGTFEQLFSYDGEPGHEIWRVYDGDIREDWPYDAESFTFVEPDLGTEHLARWISLERLHADNTTFYIPEILDELET